MGRTHTPRLWRHEKGKRSQALGTASLDSKPGFILLVEVTSALWVCFLICKMGNNNTFLVGLSGDWYAFQAPGMMPSAKQISNKKQEWAITAAVARRIKHRARCVFPRPLLFPPSTTLGGGFNYLRPSLPLASWAGSPPPSPHSQQAGPRFHSFSGLYTKGYASLPHVWRDGLLWGPCVPEGSWTQCLAGEHQLPGQARHSHYTLFPWQPMSTHPCQPLSLLPPHWVEPVW